MARRTANTTNATAKRPRQPSLPPLPEPVRFDPNRHTIDAHEEREHLLSLVFAQQGAGKLPTAALTHALRSLGSVTALRRLSPEELSDLLGCPLDIAEGFETAINDPALKQQVREECRRLDAGPDRVLSLLDGDYPPMLRFAPAPPLALWVRGRPMPQDAAAIALLGSSRCSPPAAAQATRYAQHLAEQGVTVLSGGEVGIDATVTETAIHHGGRVIVALGAGLQAHHRPKLQSLYDRLTQTRDPVGMMLSTVPLLTPPSVVNQVAGDNLVAHLALACVVIRSRRNGGALIAARLAHEAGRPLLAVPGEPDAEDVQGCHQLLASGRATLALNPNDALEAAIQTVAEVTQCHAQRRWLQPHFTAEHPMGPAERQDRRLISELRRSDTPLDLDRLASQAELDRPEAARRLTRLRLMGLIRYDATTHQFSRLA
ncbi:MAG: DNA-processing protein DprA [Planctomycetota bacterium]